MSNKLLGDFTARVKTKPIQEKPSTTKSEKQDGAASSSSTMTNNQRNAEWEKILDGLKTFELLEVHVNLWKRKELLDAGVVQIFASHEGKDFDDPSAMAYTPMDHKLGPVSRRHACGTCGNSIEKCTGHMGYVVLGDHTFIHPLYFDIVTKVLQSVCTHCGKPKKTREELAAYQSLSDCARLTAIANDSKDKSAFCAGEVESEEVDPVTGQKRVRCPASPVYSHKKNTIFISYSDGKNGKKIRMPEKMIEMILHKIKPEDAELLGFDGDSHPEDMMITHFPVSPNCSRPIAVRDGIAHAHDFTDILRDLALESAKLKDLSSKVSVSKTLKKGKETLKESETDDKQPEKDQLINNIYYYMLSLMTNKGRSNTSYGGKKTKNLEEMFKGKWGIPRRTLIGKRVDFTARSVISPAPFLKFGEIAVPRKFRDYLTFTHTVTEENKAMLQDLYNRDEVKSIWPIALGGVSNIIVRVEKSRLVVGKNGSSHYETYYERISAVDRELEIGDRVEVLLQDGQFVIFNRQPSLHAVSMMAARVVLWDNWTIGLNMSYVTPLNADFDGDEINLHMVQTIEALRDLLLTMAVEKNFISRENNKPNMAIVYDSLTAALALTRKVQIKDKDGSVLAEKEAIIGYPEFLNLVNLLNRTSFDLMEFFNRCKRNGVPLYRKFRGESKNPQLKGVKEVLKQVPWDEVSFTVDDALIEKWGERYPQMKNPAELQHMKNDLMLLGRTVFSILLPGDFYYSKGSVVIKEGIMTKGQLSKDIIGTSHGSIVQALHQDYTDGIGRTARFITEAQFILIKWFDSYGFTFGYEDCIIEDPRARVKIREAEEKMAFNIDRLGPRPSNPIEALKWEKAVSAETNQVSEVCKQIGDKYADPYNGIVVAKESGAKGSGQNVAQVLCMVGQQYIDGKRPGNDLVYFQRDDDSVEANGYCANSFEKGLNPAEFVRHAAAGRLGALNTTMKVPESGYMYNKLMNILRNVIAGGFGEVFSRSTRIIYDQCYGGDNFDPACLEMVTINGEKVPSFINIARICKRLNAKYGYTNQD